MSRGSTVSLARQNQSPAASAQTRLTRRYRPPTLVPGTSATGGAFPPTAPTSLPVSGWSSRPKPVAGRIVGMVRLESPSTAGAGGSDGRPMPASSVGPSTVVVSGSSSALARWRGDPASGAPVAGEPALAARGPVVFGSAPLPGSRADPSPPAAPRPVLASSAMPPTGGPLSLDTEPLTCSLILDGVGGGAGPRTIGRPAERFAPSGPIGGRKDRESSRTVASDSSDPAIGGRWLPVSVPRRGAILGADVPRPAVTV